MAKKHPVVCERFELDEAQEAALVDAFAERMIRERGGVAGVLAMHAAREGELTMARLFHGTTRAAADEILRRGFVDGNGRYLTDHEHRGVWLSDQVRDQEVAAIGGVNLTVDIPDDLVAGREWIEEGKDYREWCVPAAILNASATVTLASKTEA